ncbi:putative trans-zeatin O-beta-D-glucosyltransferase [Helianthus annuus]|nr:putative trans-zeatin O-beta-D-glucosyltransferase [Helianthus annuus]KAJ0529488.1 putative trans-zeatin O-beta-D-glucosyltransferase [Helianthus annuus]
MLQQRLEQRFDSINPRPNCIISDKFMLWTDDRASKFKIPRIVFDGMSCFKQVVTHYLYAHKVFEELPESESFVLPGLPDRIEITRAQLPPEFNYTRMATSEQLERVRETESRAYGMVINSFEELEKEYVKEFKKLKGGKVWCLGPLSLSNDNDIGESLRGDGVDDQPYVKWLDSKEHGSVLIVQVVGIGVSVGAPFVVHWGEEDNFGVTVKSEQVKTAIERVMDVGSEGNEIRKKAKALGMVAKKAIEGGSSHNNMTLLIQDLLELANAGSQRLST